jgi:uncharacterized protein (TIGR02996 family)
MNEEQAFLQEIEKNPNDDTSRLVYADWLDERGDPRAAYLRAEVTLAAVDPKSPDADEPRRRLMDARAGADPPWLGRLEQPGVLRAVPVPYEAAWVGTDLGDYRPGGGTYDEFGYRGLPPLPVERFTGDLRWLGEAKSERTPAGLTGLAKKVHARHLTLPVAYLSLLSSPSLRRRVRSCTDSFFWTPSRARLFPAPKAPGSFVLRFYSDSQGCYHWYLFLAPSGAHCVVGSDFSPEDEPEEAEEGRWHFCAPSFEAFLYREWIENEIWYALNWDHVPLTADQQAYVDHYSKKR